MSDIEQFGEAVDKRENQVFLGGSPNQTISMHAATAAAKGERWGCLLCWWLAHTVEFDHCGKTLAGTSTALWPALRAGWQLLVLAGVPALAAWWLL